MELKDPAQQLQQASGAAMAEDWPAALEAARQALLAAGWTIGEKGHAVASDEPNYTGRGFTAKFLET